MGFTAIVLCGERLSGAYIGIQSLICIFVLFILFFVWGVGVGGGWGGVGWVGRLNPKP